MNPQLSAKLALKSKVKKLVLTHFDAALYTTMAKREKTQAQARFIFPETISAYDGLRIVV
jgi:ribonuclease BN (tRNA processing enzyme)